tara:strand:- start:123 stop:368 length:246 start_codon:yes stop_codon:yes gene_type:complete
MKCLEECKKHSVSCPNQECRHWIDYEGEYNCVLETVGNNGCMSLREVADRLGISFVRVQQIEKAALKKMRTNAKKHSIYSK